MAKKVYVHTTLQPNLHSKLKFLLALVSYQTKHSKS